MNCISLYCKATAKVRVNPRFIQTFPNFYKKSNGKFRSKFALDLTNPELRNLNNWEVLYHPPKFKSDFRSEFEYKVLFSNLNPRKAKTLNNMKNRRKIADEYELLSYDGKSLFVLQYCYKFPIFKPLAIYAVNSKLDIFPILKTPIPKKNSSKMIQLIRQLIISKMSLKIFDMNLN